MWNTVDFHQRKGLTSVIHGKYGHEETMATTSFCEDFVCVKNMEEAEYVANYIVNGGNKEEVRKRERSERCNERGESVSMYEQLLLNSLVDVAHFAHTHTPPPQFMEKFKHATSKGFDPDTMLDKIGLANQTTMYKKEVRAEETRNPGSLVCPSLTCRYFPPFL